MGESGWFGWPVSIGLTAKKTAATMTEMNQIVRGAMLLAGLLPMASAHDPGWQHAGSLSVLTFCEVRLQSSTASR